MTTIYLVTHPEVMIDPAIPVPDWQLSERGWSRIKSFCARPELSTVSDVFTSSERKATDCAEALKAERRLEFKIEARLGENDRSSTGYVEPPRFWEIVARFFDSPHESVLGWERAIDAQTRIREAVADCVASREGGGDICIFSHGGVGTLLLCDLMGEPISRKRGQPISGGGCYFAFEAEKRTLIHGWQDIASS
ncbi:histidine phosphatase family protein [Methylosinus sp. LW3]|uniref:histidine phosphatase family protein n=1 Tax=Methylosinus sp. LW3 TaxID=107635 RepID=UPI000463E79D|nr:histidine phosphatase family protein [Methylosinus sp. LW3]